MKAFIPLSEALQRAALAIELEQPPPDLRARIQAQLQCAPMLLPGARPAASALGRSRWSWPRAWAWACSGAAGGFAVLLVSVLLMLSQPAPLPAAAEGLPSAFVPLVPADRWPAGADAAWLVRTELRGDRLAAMGLPFDPANAGDSVRAELLVHPSGELLAVRFMR